MLLVTRLPNIFYHNNHYGAFVDLALQAGVAYNDDGTEQTGTGLSADDYSHSGSQDIVKTNFSDDIPTLYLNRGNNNLEDVTRSAGLGNNEERPCGTSGPVRQNRPPGFHPHLRTMSHAVRHSRASSARRTGLRSRR